MVDALGTAIASNCSHLEHHRALRALRDTGPVVRVTLYGTVDAWLVTRYDDVVAALRDRRLSSDSAHLGAGPARSTVKFSMMAMDPPEHARLRRIASVALTPRRVAELGPRIAELAESLLSRLGPTPSCDLISSFALPLPLAVICELLGIPPTDRGRFEEWSNEMLAPVSDPAGMRRMSTARARLGEYLESLLAAKRAAPGNDLLTALVEARDVTDEELVELGVLLLVAGYETTVSLIGNALLALLLDERLLVTLRADPAAIPGAVEEFLRYDGPLGVGVTRYTTEPVEIAGVRIPRGERIVLGLAVANRDTDRFPDPDSLDPARADNPHLGFGHGWHYCLGASLARLEARIALESVIRRFPTMRLAVPVERLRWRESIFRCLVELPVSLTVAAGPPPPDGPPQTGA